MRNKKLEQEGIATKQERKLSDNRQEKKGNCNQRRTKNQECNRVNQKC